MCRCSRRCSGRPVGPAGLSRDCLMRCADSAPCMLPQTRARGGSVMQPLGRLQQAGNECAAAAIAAEPGTSAFAALAAADVKPDAVCLFICLLLFCNSSFCESRVSGLEVKMSEFWS